MNLEAFIITNGKSTFEFAYRTLLEQTMKVKVTVLKDMLWEEALQKCVRDCKSTHFLRCDDDMMLHPLALEYMWYALKNECSYTDEVVMLIGELYETYTYKYKNRIKIYNKRGVEELGGFNVNKKTGKIDRVFMKLIHTSPKWRKYLLKNSGVGLHTCGSWEEQLKYEKLWDKLGNDKKKYKTPRRENIMKYDKTPEEQYDLRLQFLEDFNARYEGENTFYEYIKNHD